MAILDRSAMNNKKKEVQNYYTQQNIRKRLASTFEDTEKSGEELKKIFAGVEKQMQDLAKDKAFDKYAGQLRMIEKQAQKLIDDKSRKNIKQTTKETEALLSAVSDLVSKMDQKQLEVYGESVSKLSRDSREAMQNMQDYLEAVRQTEGDSPFKKAFDDLRSHLSDLANINTANLIKNFGQTSGMTNYKSRDELALAFSSREEAYDVLSSFARENMRLNKEMKNAVLGQGQSVALMNTLITQGVNSTSWMKREYDTLVKLQETLGANNILTQAIVDNTYALRGGSDQAMQYYDALMAEAKNLGINLSKEELQGRIQSAMDTIRQGTLRDASINRWSDEYTQQALQDRLEKAFTRGGEAWTNILSGNQTRWAQDVISNMDKSYSQLIQDNPLLGLSNYSPNSSVLEYPSASNQASQQILTNDPTVNRELMGQFGSIVKSFEYAETERNTRLQAQAMGGGTAYEKTDQQIQEKHTTLFEAIANNLSNWVGSSKSGLETFDNIELFVQNVSDIGKATFGVIADIFTLQKAMNLTEVGILGELVSLNIKTALGNLTGGANMAKILPAVGKFSAIAIGVTAAVSAITQIADLVGELQRQDKEVEKMAEDMTEEDKKQTESLKKQSQTKKIAATATGAAVGTAAGAAGGYFGVKAGAAAGGAIGAAFGGIGAVPGAIIGGLIGLAAGIFGGRAVGEAISKDEDETINGAGVTQAIRNYDSNTNPYGYKGKDLESVYNEPEGGPEYTGVVDSSIPITNKKRKSINGIPVSQLYGEDRFGDPNTGGGYFNGIWHESKHGVTISAGYPKYNLYGSGISADSKTGKLVNSGRSYARGKSHSGMDLAVVTGTAVGAPVSGTAYAKSSKGGYGTYVTLSGDDGKTYYFGHLSRQTVSSSGTKVDKGTTIGYSGNTGNSTGPHLHFEVRSGNGTVNPYGYFTTAVSSPGRAPDSYSDPSGTDNTSGESGTSESSNNSGILPDLQSSYSLLETSLSSMTQWSQKGIKFNNTALAIGGPERDSDAFVPSSPNINTNQRDYEFVNPSGPKIIQHNDNTDILRTMTNNFKSLETVIQKVSVMEMQYQDLKDSLRVNRDYPELSFSD